MDGRSEEKHERKTQENTRTQMLSKIEIQKKCVIFEKLNVVDSESFAQVVKKSERKKRPLETKEGLPASKGLSDVLHKIDQNNVKLYQSLVMCLNPKTVVGAKSLVIYKYYF